MACYARRKLLEHRCEPGTDNKDTNLPAHRFGVCKGIVVTAPQSGSPYSTNKAVSMPDQHRQGCQVFRHQAPFASLTLPQQAYNIRKQGANVTCWYSAAAYSRQFASQIACSGNHAARKPCSNLQFVIATADEREAISAKQVAKQTGVPAWRVALGNVAAGATAGCAVEAGDHAKHVHSGCCMQCKLWQCCIAALTLPQNHAAVLLRPCVQHTTTSGVSEVCYS